MAGGEAQRHAMRRSLLSALALMLLAPAPAAAIVGVGASIVRDAGPGRHIVMIISTRGNVCTGTALARDLVLTAAHCVAPQATYRVSTPDHPKGFATARIAVHPRYDAENYRKGRVTADVALIRLAEPLPAAMLPAPLGRPERIAAGDRLVIAGYGTVAPRSDAGLGVPRAATLTVTGRPGNLQIRLVDPQAQDTRFGLGACTGDSGGPAFQQRDGTYEVVGIVSWSTGPKFTTGCGGLTGLTPLSLHRNWIERTAESLGSPLGP